MKKIKKCLKGSVRPENLRSVQVENIKITGTEQGIALIEAMFSDMEIKGDIEMVSTSQILNNKGENRKRKFLEIIIRNVEEWLWV